MEDLSSNALMQISQPFRLPSAGDMIVSESTSIRYVIGDEISNGGFGIVYECIDSFGNHLVAKVLRPVDIPIEMHARAANEFMAAQICGSAHVVQVHEAFVLNGAYYIISERCVRSLADAMAESQTTSAWFPAVVKAVLQGLHSMHCRGLMHGDVHAGDVFIHAKHDVLVAEELAFDIKIGDFGQTRLISEGASRSTWHPSFTPPEVISPDEFGPLDQRADLYQAGLLFLSLAVNTTLFFDATDVLAGKPRELAESLNAAYSEPLAKMLRRHASARPTSALETWNELRPCLQLA